MNVAARIADEGVSEPFFDLEDLYKMTAAGLFPEGRNVELVDGRLYMAPSEGTPHLGLNGFTAHALHALIAADPVCARPSWPSATARCTWREDVSSIQTPSSCRSRS
jgi:hypothetical protein